MSNAPQPAFPVISAASQVMAHAPGLARHGSKPRRELPRDAQVEAKFLGSLRSFDEAVAYGPNQAYLNAIHPRELPAASADRQRFTPAGELMPEIEFLGLLALVDEFGLLTLDADFVGRAGAALAEHPLAKRFDLDHLEKAKGDAKAVASEPLALPIYLGADTLVGALRAGQDDDESLSAHVLLENLAGKATASLALLHLLQDNDIEAESIDYVIGCGEEAIGDRYQRGGGNMAKAVAQFAGLANASGADLKNFCAAPVPALVVAASLVASGVFERVAVIAPGSLPKLGMKFQGHLKNNLPVLEDVLGGAATLIEADDQRSPVVRLDSVGRHTVSAGGSATQIMEALAVAPLDKLGLAMTDVDDYATELHDPGVTEPQGSGNVPDRNYKTIAALAVRKGAIERDQLTSFVTERGMPGFAPTQGHLASALCYLPHALGRLTTGDANRVMLLAKGSLFLGRMCELSDGMSVLLERNPALASAAESGILASAAESDVRG